jgi:hypothetical protein
MGDDSHVGIGLSDSILEQAPENSDTHSINISSSLPIIYNGKSAYASQNS